MNLLKRAKAHPFVTFVAGTMLALAIEDIWVQKVSIFSSLYVRLIDLIEFVMSPAPGPFIIYLLIGAVALYTVIQLTASKYDSDIEKCDYRDALKELQEKCAKQEKLDNFSCRESSVPNK